jgi:acyl carrier protein
MFLTTEKNQKTLTKNKPMSIEKIIIPATITVIAGINGIIIIEHNGIKSEISVTNEVKDTILTKDEVRSKIIEISSKELGVDINEIIDNTNFKNDLGADSLDVVELVMKWETEFDVFISDNVAEKISTVGEAVDVVYDIYSNGISLFTGNDFTGSLKKLSGDYDITFNGFSSGGLSSIIVPKGFSVQLFTERDFTGDYIIINTLEGEIKIKNFSEIKPSKNIIFSKQNLDWNNKINSVKVKKYDTEQKFRNN